MIEAQAKTARTSNSTIWKLVIRYRTILILIVLMIVFTLLKPVFLNPLNLLAILKNMSYVLIAGLGMTFIITLGGLDLSVGSIAAVVGVGFAMLVRGELMPALPALFIVMIAALLLGFFNGFVSVKGKIEPFLVTLATMFIYRGLALTLTAGKPVPIVIPYFADLLGNGTLFNLIPSPVIISLIVLLVSWFVFTRTKFGFYVRSIGGNPEAARVAGINISLVKIAAYTMNGGVRLHFRLDPGCADELWAARCGIHPGAGQYLRRYPGRNGDIRRSRLDIWNAGRLPDHGHPQQRYVADGRPVPCADIGQRTGHHPGGIDGQRVQVQTMMILFHGRHG